MKKTLKIYEHLTNTDIYICYGNEEYQKIQKKLNIGNKIELKCNGYASRIDSDNGNFICYLVGINDNTDNVYWLKSTIVHELSHIVTFIMEKYGFVCDEYRSYLLGYLYEKTMVWFDKVLRLESL